MSYTVAANDTTSARKGTIEVADQTVYGQNHGRAGWNWEPSSCADGRVASAAFADASIASGSTAVQAVHLRDLRGRIDALRVAAGLSTFVWTDPELIYGVTPVKAVHVNELRAALDATYAAAGRAVPLYTDNAIVAGVTPIKATHMAELRAAVVAAEE